MHYPSNPFQLGPIYFLTPRKCAIFGVCCEAVPRQVNNENYFEILIVILYLQVNYLIDEACNTGKGGNTVISLLHHFLATHGVGEASVHFHADNCSGQNKNRFLMYYFMWRILVGLHQEIKYPSFLSATQNFHRIGVLD